MFHSERLGGGEQLMEYIAVLGFETAPLGRAQALVGQTEVGQCLKCLSEQVEPLFEASSQGAQRRNAATVRPYHLNRLGQQSAALRIGFRNAIGADQGQRLPSLEPVSFDGLADLLLVLGLQTAERLGQGHSHLSGVEAPGHRRRQSFSHRQPIEDPTAFFATAPGDGLRAQALLVTQGMDHAGLVHRRERAWWAVGPQQRRVRLLFSLWFLDHHRNTRHSLCPPSFEPFESIEHLETTLFDFDHPQRQLGKLSRRTTDRAIPFSKAL